MEAGAKVAHKLRTTKEFNPGIGSPPAMTMGLTVISWTRKTLRIGMSRGEELTSSAQVMQSPRICNEWTGQMGSNRNRKMFQWRSPRIPHPSTSKACRINTMILTHPTLKAQWWRSLLFSRPKTMVLSQTCHHHKLNTKLSRELRFQYQAALVIFQVRELGITG